MVALLLVSENQIGDWTDLLKIDGVDSVIRRAGGIRKKNKVMYESFYKTTRGDVFVFTLPLMGDPEISPI